MTNPVNAGADAEQPEQCEACSFETADLTFYLYSPFIEREDKGHWLCWLCASTFAGNAHQYPDLYPHRELMFHVNLVANLMLQKLRGGGKDE